MSLYRVTITGADDSSDIDKLMSLSSEYPFLEWGILTTVKLGPRNRFPSRKWCSDFVYAVLNQPKRPNVSLHLCGVWVDKLLQGNLLWSELPVVVDISNRLQINTHGQKLISTVAMLEQLVKNGNTEFIFQWDGVNNHLAYAASAYGVNTSILFDESHGEGRLPSEWHPSTTFLCGYAGGLGPDNVLEELEKIESVCHRPFWIDMETKVRKANDSMLDMEAIGKVLELCASSKFWKRH